MSVSEVFPKRKNERPEGRTAMSAIQKRKTLKDISRTKVFSIRFRKDIFFILIGWAVVVWCVEASA